MPGALDTAIFQPDNGGSNGNCNVAGFGSTVIVASVQMDSSYGGVFTVTGGPGATAFDCTGLFFEYGTTRLDANTTTGTCSINGQLSLAGSVLTCSGFALYATGVVAQGGTGTIDSQTYDDVGTIDITGGLIIDKNFTASAGSVTTVSGGAGLTFADASAVNITGGTLNLGTAGGEGGATIALGGATLDMAGTLNTYVGANVITGGAVLQDGDLNFIDAGAFQTLTIGGNFSQTSNAITSMSIGASGANDDVAAGDNDVALAGTLNVSGAPAGGGVWDLFTGAVVSGGFASQNLPAPPPNFGWTWGVAGTGPQAYFISLVTPPP